VGRSSPTQQRRMNKPENAMKEKFWAWFEKVNQNMGKGEMWLWLLAILVVFWAGMIHLFR
jgi:hypothetical protein